LVEQSVSGIINTLFHNMMKQTKLPTGANVTLCEHAHADKRKPLSYRFDQQGDTNMRTQTPIILIVVLTLLFTTNAAAQAWKDTVSKAKYDRVEKNLLIGLASDNLGLRASCAYMLGEIGSTNAMIPLMGVLHNEASEGARIMAALSLYKIGTPMGNFAVKRASRFDDSERVRKACSRFYNEFTKYAQSVTETIAIFSLAR
jgi:hypothetical protein